ncbi:4-coumarate--CoA ligase 1-like [Diachasma alloeum]|uniref:4-coumarate--CoA ligase 1-like n=1 Tax=Diachasma alloeum TaxID=454923 RepID=UPI000738419A|nr:4-coumarate--CoA ligase 1-like [Diachasma alloeum]
MMNAVSKKYPHINFEDGIWKGPTKSYPEENLQIGKRLLRSLKEAPNFVGQIDSATGEEDSFAAMMDRSIRCALWLRKRGIGPGDTIAVAANNHQDTVIPILASLYIGCVLNPYPFDWLANGLISHFMNMIEPKIIFADEDLAQMMHEHNDISNEKVEIIVFGSLPGLASFEEILLEQKPSEVENFEWINIRFPAETAMLMFTSGTTGYPKVFQYSYRHLERDLNWLPREELHGKVGTWCIETAWTVIIITVLSSIINRSTYVIHKFTDIPELCRVIEKYKIDWSMLRVEHINILSRLPNPEDFDLSSLKFIRYCGSYIRPEIEKNLHAIFPRTWLSQSYGLTEVGAVTYTMRDHKCPACGIPAENTEIKLINSKNEIIMCPNQSGELCVRTPCLSIVYYKNKTASEITLDSDSWHHTGDLVYYNEDGEFFIVDRIKEIIRFRFSDVPAGVVENCILKHPGVLEVAVVSKLHDEDVEQPMAFIVKKPHVQVTEKEIEGWVEQQLPDHMRLRGGVKFIDTMVYNNSGKIRKGLLRHLANDH